MITRLKSVRPTPGVVIGVVALVAVLGGTAVAGSDVQSSALNKKKAKQIATKQINKLAPGLSVAQAESANSATTAQSANSADTADNAQRLGGVGPGGYSTRLFARVVYAGGLPTVPAATASPGIALGAPPEPFEGGARINFGRNMTNCSVVGSSNNAGAAPIAIIRQSTLSSGNNVVMASEDSAGVGVEKNYNIIASC